MRQNIRLQKRLHKVITSADWEKSGKSNGKKRGQDYGFTEFKGKRGKWGVQEGTGEMRPFQDSDFNMQDWIVHYSYKKVWCELCGQKETIGHVMMHFGKYEEDRQHMIQKLRKEKVPFDLIDILPKKAWQVNVVKFYLIISEQLNLLRRYKLFL